MGPRRLTLLRHGQAQPADAAAPDFERPLTQHGRLEARDIAERLLRRGLVPELILTSPAERALGSALILAQTCDIDAAQVRCERELYLATPRGRVAAARGSGRFDAARPHLRPQPRLERAREPARAGARPPRARDLRSRQRRVARALLADARALDGGERGAGRTGSHARALLARTDAAGRSGLLALQAHQPAPVALVGPCFADAAGRAARGAAASRSRARRSALAGVSR